MSAKNKMDPKTFPEESYESVRPSQSQEQQKAALLHREKRQESTAEVLKKANAIIQKSKNSKNQQGNLTEFSNNQARAQEKNVDDTISEARTSMNVNAQSGNLQGDSYQNPAEIQMQSRGDRIRGERSNKNITAAQGDEEEEYTSIFNIKIEQPSSQSKIGSNPNQEYNSIFQGANLAIASATTPMTHQSQDGFEQENETTSYQDQTNRSFNSESIKNNNKNQEPESLIGKMTPHKLSVTPSKQQYVQLSSSKKEITQQQAPSSSSKIQTLQVKQQQGQVSQPTQNQGKNQEKNNNQKKNRATYDNSADQGNPNQQGDAGSVTQQAQKGQNSNNLYTEKEISQMRTMLLRRKRERIRRNAAHIIYFHLQRYMVREQNKKQHYLMVEFIHHCAHMIQRAVRRFLSRRQEKRSVLLRAVAIGWRLRRIIRLPKLLKISNDIKSMEQEKALFPEDAEGNQGIQEEISREKVNYCNSLRALQVRGKWLGNLHPEQNQDKSQKQIKKQQPRPQQKSREHDHQEPIGRETNEDEGQFDSRNQGADTGRGRQQQRDTSKQHKNIQQQQQQKSYADYPEEEYLRQRLDDGQEMEEDVDYYGSQKIKEKQFKNKQNLNSSLNNTLNKNTSLNNNNNNAKNFNHAWDDIPVGGNKQKKLNDTLKGWEDAYPAEQELDSNQRELVETKGKVERVQKKQTRDVNTKRKEQLGKQKQSEDVWDEQPIGGHKKKRMEQNWEEFPDGQQKNEKQTAAKNQEDEKEKERLREERVKRKEQRDQSAGGEGGAAVAGAPGAKKIDKDKLDNLKKRTKYDPRKAIVEAKNKQQNPDTSEAVKQSKRSPQATAVVARQKQHHEDEEEGQVPNEEDDYKFNDGDDDGQQKNQQIKATSPERKQLKNQTKQKGRQQTSQQREGQHQQQEENEPQQQGSNKEQKQQSKKEFLKKKPKVIEFQKLNWKNVKSKTNTGRQESEQKTQLFQNNFQNQQQQLRYIDELNNNNNENMGNPQGQYNQEQEQQLPQGYQNEPNYNDLRAHPSPQQNQNNINPNNFASSHNQFVTYEHFQQQQANHPNNNNNAQNRRHQQQQQQQYNDQIHPNQIAQQQGSPKVYTEHLPNKTSQKALAQLAQNQTANQEIVIRPAMFKNKAPQQQQPQQGLQQLSNGFIDQAEMGQIPQNKKQNTNAGVPDLDRMRQNKKESLLNQQQQQYNQQQQQHNQFVQGYQQRGIGDYASQQQQQQQQMQEEEQQMPFMYPTPYRSPEGKSGVKQINHMNKYEDYTISHNPVPSNSTIQELLLKKQEQFMNYGFQ